MKGNMKESVIDQNRQLISETQDPGIYLSLKKNNSADIK